MKSALFFWVLWLGVQPLMARLQNPTPPLEEARQLEEAGKKPEAFVKYLAIPGRESAAANAGRTDPNFYLALLQEKGAGIPLPRFQAFSQEFAGVLRRSEGR